MYRFIAIVSFLCITCFSATSFAKVEVNEEKAAFTKSLKMEGIDITMPVEEFTDILQSKGYHAADVRKGREEHTYAFEKRIDTENGLALKKSITYKLGVGFRDGQRFVEYFVKYQPTGVLKEWQDAPMGGEAQAIVDGLCVMVQTEKNYDGTHQSCQSNITSLRIKDSFLSETNQYYGFELDTNSSGFYTVKIKTH